MAVQAGTPMTVNGEAPAARKTVGVNTAPSFFVSKISPPEASDSASGANRWPDAITVPPPTLSRAQRARARQKIRAQAHRLGKVQSPRVSSAPDTRP